MGADAGCRASETSFNDIIYFKRAVKERERDQCEGYQCVSSSLVPVVGNNSYYQ